MDDSVLGIVWVFCDGAQVLPTRVQQRVSRLRRLKGLGTDDKKDVSLTKKETEISSTGKRDYSRII